MPHSQSRKAFALADLSMDDRAQVLSRALEKKVGRYNCYVRDVFDSSLVYYDYDDGASYRVDYAIADDFSVTFGDPVEVIERSVYEPVKMSAFSLAAPQASPGGVYPNMNVYPNSLLFEIQSDSEHFPSQGITVTKQDLADIAAGFAGATMGLEHMDTVLGESCGDIRTVWLDATGRRLFGDVAIPKGLDALIPPGPRRVSVEIVRDAEGKMSIPQVDLVLNPQIERAALMSLAAFAQNPTLQEPTLTQPSQEKRPMPTPATPAPAAPPAAPAEKNPGLWDKFVAFCTGVGFVEAEPAHFADPQVAEFRRKAQLHDAAFARRKEDAKKAAVIGFGAEEAARISGLVDAAPEGPLFDDLEQRTLDAAHKVAPPEGARRTTTPPAFGKPAQNADAPAKEDGETPKLESPSALFARRAQEARGARL